MRLIKQTIVVAVGMWAAAALATPMNDYAFKSSSLNGSNYSTFQMALENEQYTRQQAVLQAIQSAAATAAANAANTPLQQFLTNLESRIYAQISQNVATSMFSASGTVQPGSIAFGAGSISWSQTITTGGVSAIQLQVFDGTNTTTINVPMGQFQ
jgi:hypothetical protein